jgi:leucyl aminopeptidase
MVNRDYAILLFKDEKEKILPETFMKIFFENQKKTKFKFNENEYFIVKNRDSQWIIFMGGGKIKEFSAFKLREIYQKLNKIAETLKIKKITLLNNTLRKISFDYKFEIGLMNSLLNYKFTKKSKKDGKKSFKMEINGIPKESEVYGEAINFTRSLINGSAENINPESMEKIVYDNFSSENFKIKTIKGTELEKRGFGGIIAVGKGGGKPPRLINIEYKHKKAEKTVSLVGKTVTFDSGGLNVKPYKAMEDMKIDMSGGAVVLGILKLANELNLPINIKGYIPTVENMPGPVSYKQGDFVKIYNGKTVEIKHTDAEGRLIIADALSLAAEEKTELIMDFATLTGAAISALGTKIAAILGNNNSYIKKLMKIGWENLEPLWQLPMPEFYEKDIESDIADLKNTGYGEGGGTLKAAMFLREFIKGKKWIHIDIAGPSFFEKGDFFGLKKATGFGVRTIIDFLKQF